MRCIIVDDEFPARLLLKDFVEKVPSLQLLGSFSSPLEALPLVQKGEVDLMFLDIQMPDVTGVNFVKLIAQYKPLVVFTTAYSEYAIESYQLDVLDYLLKPFSFDRFMQAVGKAMTRMKSQEAVLQQSSSAQAEASDEAQNGVLLVKADHKIYRLQYTDINYIEGLREYVTIHTSSGQKIVTLESLKKLEDTLPSQLFMRVHKSYIVRISCITQLYGAQIMVEGAKDYIPLGKSYKDVVEAKLFS